MISIGMFDGVVSFCFSSEISSGLCAKLWSLRCVSIFHLFVISRFWIRPPARPHAFEQALAKRCLLFAWCDQWSKHYRVASTRSVSSCDFLWCVVSISVAVSEFVRNITLYMSPWLHVYSCWSGCICSPSICVLTYISSSEKRFELAG